MQMTSNDNEPVLWIEERGEWVLTNLFVPESIDHYREITGKTFRMVTGEERLALIEELVRVMNVEMAEHVAARLRGLTTAELEAEILRRPGKSPPPYIAMDDLRRSATSDLIHLPRPWRWPAAQVN
jgi:hypothetical protein